MDHMCQNRTNSVQLWRPWFSPTGVISLDLLICVCFLCITRCILLLKSLSPQSPPFNCKSMLPNGRVFFPLPCRGSEPSRSWTILRISWTFSPEKCTYNTSLQIISWGSWTPRPTVVSKAPSLRNLCVSDLSNAVALRKHWHRAGEGLG